MSIHDFTCKDCGHTFSTAEDFSNHFQRDGDSIAITGCKDIHKGRIDASPKAKE